MTGENDAQSELPTPENDPGESGTATLASPKEKRAPSPRKPGYLPQFKVLLHNDDVNTVEHVVRSVFQLTPLAQEEAIQKTIEADQSGVALLLVTHQERAELYQEQFASLSLTVTIEPDA